MNRPSKDITHYLNLPYTIRLRRDDTGDIVARIEELPGCISHGSDEGEALSNLREMQKLWFEDSIAAGQPIPEPENDEPLPSGKWVQRVPRSLHRRLVQMARAESVSLNQLVTSMLSEQLSKNAVERSMKQLLEHYVALRPGRVWHYWDTLAGLLPGNWQIDADVENTMSFHNAMVNVIPSGVEVKVPHESKEEGYFLATCER